MKKYLLTALLGVFGFVGAFVSADYTFQGTMFGCEYTPSQLVLTEDLTIDSSNFSYTLFDGIRQSAFNIGDVCEINYDHDILSIGAEGYCSLSAGTYNLFGGGESAFSSVSISFSDSGTGDNSGGSLLPGGESDLSGIITGLNSTINEFIPYLVYLGLGIITVIIGFVAIRWLVNRTQAKIRGTFSSGKRRR